MGESIISDSLYTKSLRTWADYMLEFTDRLAVVATVPSKLVSKNNSALSRYLVRRILYCSRKEYWWVLYTATFAPDKAKFAVPLLSALQLDAFAQTIHAGLQFCKIMVALARDIHWRQICKTCISLLYYCGSVRRIFSTEPLCAWKK